MASVFAATIYGGPTGAFMRCTDGVVFMILKKKRMIVCFFLGGGN